MYMYFTLLACRLFTQLRMSLGFLLPTVCFINFNSNISLVHLIMYMHTCNYILYVSSYGTRQKKLDILLCCDAVKKLRPDRPSTSLLPSFHQPFTRHKLSRQCWQCLKPVKWPFLQLSGAGYVIGQMYRASRCCKTVLREAVLSQVVPLKHGKIVVRAS